MSDDYEEEEEEEKENEDEDEDEDELTTHGVKRAAEVEYEFDARRIGLFNPDGDTAITMALLDVAKEDYPEYEKKYGVKLTTKFPRLARTMGYMLMAILAL